MRLAVFMCVIQMGGGFGQAGLAGEHTFAPGCFLIQQALWNRHDFSSFFPPPPSSSPSLSL